MNQDERLAKNIRSLRKAYGEKQEKLGAAVDFFEEGITQQAISKIEQGKSKVTKETLVKLADHFMVSPEELLNDDFSSLLKVNPNIEKMRDSYRVLFPVVSTDVSLKDESFRKGVEAHEALYECLSTANLGVNQVDQLFEVALEAYSKVGESAEDDACANTLALWFFLFSFITSMDVILSHSDSSEAAPIKMLRDTDPMFNRIVKQSRQLEENDPSVEKERRDIIREMKNEEVEKEIIELIKQLKKSRRLNYLADYYLALRYFYNMVSNGFKDYFNRRIGSELLFAFEELGNPAAKQFTQLCIESWRPEHKK